MKKPQELIPGDTFVAPSGPYRGHRVKVVSAPEPGVGGTYNVQCKIIPTVKINIDYKAELEVKRA